MSSTTFKLATATTLIIAFYSACSNSDFSGDSASNYQKKVAKPRPSSTGTTTPLGPSNETTSNPNDLEVDSNGLAIIRPRVCDARSISFVQNEGRCAENSAAYVIDDSRSVYVGCCPLPASDILAKNAVPTNRTTCSSGEIAVGAGGGGLLCMPINSSRYILASPKQPCYLGHGASGGTGSEKCGAPTALISAMTTNSTFGTDACVPAPFGSLITARTGKQCSNTLAAQLLFKDTGLPVPMFKE